MQLESLTNINAVKSLLAAMPEDEVAAMVASALAATSDLIRVPNPGPQTEAYYCEADELFYGGSAGCGKSGFLILLSLTEHTRSLLLRRTNKEADGFVFEFEEVLGNRDGFNGQKGTWRIPGTDKVVQLGGCQLENDKQGYKGIPRDLYGFDEISDFSETQYTFIKGWNRSTKHGQRCRVVACGNPPTRPEGLWVIKRWAAWLDPNHPNPALPGELRWYTTGEEGKEIEVDGQGPHEINGEMVKALSRTFIPGKLADNPDLAETNYSADLAALPEELRRAYRDGRFDAALKDEDFQLIPTDWVRAAQERWTPQGRNGNAMTAMGFDPAGGGKDDAALACRYGGWYAPIITLQGPETADGTTMASHVFKHRKDNCPIVIDVGGGYAGAVITVFKDNSIPFRKFNGAETSTAKTKDRLLKFYNKRAGALWKLREELDPDQEGGSCIALPVDPELLSDLCALTWKLTTRGIQIISKEDLKAKLGRSTGKGDAVFMALSEGDMAVQRSEMFTGGRAPQVVTKRPRRK